MSGTGRATEEIPNVMRVHVSFVGQPKGRELMFFEPPYNVAQSVNLTERYIVPGIAPP